MNVKTLKVGGITYKVEEVKDLHLMDGEGNKSDFHGLIYHDSATIQLEQDQSEDVKKATLIHEALHAILTQSGHENHDESVITALGYGLLRFIRDNKALIRLLERE